MNRFVVFGGCALVSMVVASRAALADEKEAEKKAAGEKGKDSASKSVDFDADAEVQTMDDGSGDEADPEKEERRDDKAGDKHKDDDEDDDKDKDKGDGEEKISAAGDLHVGMPLGGLGDLGSVGFGLKARGEYWLLANVAVGLRLGYVHHIGSGSASFGYIPAQLSGRYFFKDTRLGGYVGGEVGPNFSFVSGTVAGVDVSGSGVDFGLLLRGGYALGPDLPIDVSLLINIMNLAHAGDTIAIGIEAGYTFAWF